MKTLYESIFDIDDNIDAVGYAATYCGKLGIKSITFSIFSTQYDDITEDSLKKIVLDNFSKDFDLGIDAKVFDKNIKIYDRLNNDELNVNPKNKTKIYNIAERVLQELADKEDRYQDVIGNSTGVRNEMEAWLKNNIKGSTHQFRYWRKSGTIQVVFCPRRGNYIVRMYISTNENLQRI